VRENHVNLGIVLLLIWKEVKGVSTLDQR